MLLALDRLGVGWRVDEIKVPECPCCESQRVALVIDAAGEPFTEMPARLRRRGVHRWAGPTTRREEAGGVTDPLDKALKAYVASRARLAELLVLGSIAGNHPSPRDGRGGKAYVRVDLDNGE